MTIHLSGLLKTKEEVLDAVNKLEKINLDRHHDLNKCWDCYKAYSNIISETFSKNKVNILDAGSGNKPVILRWLSRESKFNLYACDYESKYTEYMDNYNIKFSKCDIGKTSYQDLFFDSVYSISVIEHGVDLVNYFKEMYRITKPSGTLHISTDYWPTKIQTSHKFPYGTDKPPMKVFSRDELKLLIKLAKDTGFSLDSESNLFDDITIPVVRWERMLEEYTFVYLRFIK